MSLAHACPSCGQQLSRVRASLDPHYNLPIVTCPGCTVSYVRRRHPILTGARHMLALRQSVARVALTPLFLVLLLIGAIWSSSLTLDVLRVVGTDWVHLVPAVFTTGTVWDLPPSMEGTGEAFSPLLIAFFTFTAGLLAGFALIHWRKVAIVLGWFVCWQGAIAIPVCVATVDRLLINALKFEASPIIAFGSTALDTPLNLAMASLYGLPVHFAGVLIGRSLVRLAGANARRRWIRRRRAIRRRRESR